MTDTTPPAPIHNETFRSNVLPDHVGSVVAFVPLGLDVSGLDKHLRELTVADHFIAPVKYVAASCSCGWRSHRFTAIGASWEVPMVLGSQAMLDKCYRLWQRHIADYNHRALGED